MLNLIVLLCSGSFWSIFESTWLFESFKKYNLSCTSYIWYEDSPAALSEGIFLLFSLLPQELNQRSSSDINSGSIRFNFYNNDRSTARRHTNPPETFTATQRERAAPSHRSSHSFLCLTSLSICHDLTHFKASTRATVPVPVRRTRSNQRPPTCHRTQSAAGSRFLFLRWAQISGDTDNHQLLHITAAAPDIKHPPPLLWEETWVHVGKAPMIIVPLFEI